VALCLSNRLFHVGKEAIFADGPRSDERLVKEILRVAVGELPGLKTPIHARPAIQSRLPSARHLGQRSEASANIFASFRVVRRQCRHGQWMRGLHMRAVVMKFFDRQSVAPGRATHFVEADHAVEAVECGVFNPLGHHRGGELLKAQKEFAFPRAALAKHENVGDEFE